MSTSRWIQVDDTDSGISYTGSWFQDNGSQNNLGHFGPPFLNTLHGTNAGGSSFSYSFLGSRVLITGTVQYPYTSGISNPSWQCIIDGQAVGMLLYTDPENRLRLCERDDMDDSQLHTITVKVSVSDQHTFWLDYVQYLPADSTSISNAFVSIDSSDPAIQFSDAGSWKSSYPGYVTSTTGASLKFQFQGVSITWMGFYDKKFAMKATTATYSIDGGTPTPFTLDGSGAIGPGVLYNQVFFQSGHLPSGSHTLTVVYQGDFSSTPLGLYTLVVQNGPGGSTSGGSGSGSSGTGTGPVITGGSGSSGSGSSQTSTSISGKTSSSTSVKSGNIDVAPTTVVSLGAISAGQDHTTAATSSGLQSTGVTANGDSHAASSNTGPIIGGVIGGLALIAIAIFGYLLLRRRSNRDLDRNHFVEPFNHNPRLTSYEPTIEPSQSFPDPSMYSHPQLPPPQSSKRAMLDAHLGHSNTDPRHTRTTSAGTSVEQTTSLSRSRDTSSTPDPHSGSFTVDEDSGIRFRRTLQDGQMVQILPPVYSVA